MSDRPRWTEMPMGPAKVAGAILDGYDPPHEELMVLARAFLEVED